MTSGLQMVILKKTLWIQVWMYVHRDVDIDCRSTVM